jgi:hypothetical protein
MADERWYRGIKALSNSVFGVCYSKKFNLLSIPQN